MRRHQRLRLIEIILATVLALVGIELSAGLVSAFGIYIAFALIPLVYIALRYGGALATILGAVVGFIKYFIPWPEQFEITTLILFYILPFLSVGLAGFFTKNVHRTINNLRFQSTRLNIITSSLIVTLVYYLVRFGLVPWATNTISEFPLNHGMTWLGWGLSFAVVLAVLLITMKKWLLPPRSPYLSRRETSSLLND